MNSIDARGRPRGPLARPTRGWQLDLGDAGAVTLLDRFGAGIHSAGVDLVEVARIRRAVLRSGEAFVRRVFGERERATVSRDPDRRIAELAALFGVKESVVKAMGGMPPGGNYADICVDICVDLPDSSARAVRLTGELAHWAAQHRVEVLAGSAPAGDGMLLSWALALARDAPSTGGLASQARSGEAAPGAAGTGQPHTGGPHTGGPHTGQPHTGQPHTGQPHTGEVRS
jgi:holo-[acyl-carrier protein] synthase